MQIIKKMALGGLLSAVLLTSNNVIYPAISSQDVNAATSIMVGTCMLPCAYIVGLGLVMGGAGGGHKTPFDRRMTEMMAIGIPCTIGGIGLYLISCGIDHISTRLNTAVFGSKKSTQKVDESDPTK